MSGTVITFPAHPARVAVTAVDDAVGELAAANLWSMSDRDLLDLRAGLEETRARLDAAVLAATREVDARGAAVAVGAASTAAWLRSRLLMHPAAAKAEVGLARDLDQQLPATGQALREGRFSADAARAITAAMRDLPKAVDPSTYREAETFLLDQATRFDPASVAKIGRHLIVTLDPDRGRALEKDEARQAHRQELTLTHHRDGSRLFRGRLGPEGGALMDAALAAVSGPRPAADGTPDPRHAPQRRAEGLLELITLAVNSDEMPEHGGEPVTLTVTTTVDYLAAPDDDGDDRCDDGPTGPTATRPAATGPAATGPAATLEDGTPLSPETTRRLGCDAWLVAALVDTDLQVLDIGRLSRIIPRGMRRALVIRDQGCAFPGCGRPPRWCHGHHIQHWSRGGPTALTNLVLLCGHHHRAVHHHGWEVDIGPNGRPCFTPPAWIDPSQVPRPAWRPPQRPLPC